jgi:formamidopyrimidine-DNA glycosylase
MPELPEVETVRRGLAPVFEASPITAVRLARPDLRFAFPDRFAERLAGRRVTALGRRAKYLVGDLDDGGVLIMHLGMSGSFRIEAEAWTQAPGIFHHPRGKDSAHDHVTFAFADGRRVVYNDPRRFGFMTLTDRPSFADHPLIRHLGVEPTGNALDATHLAAAFAGRSTSLKAALLDQSVIAGLGNIYVCESLWRARLAPTRPAGSIVPRSGLPGRRLAALVDSIHAVIADAIAAGGSSLRDHVGADGALGYFQHSFSVYDREDAPCPRPGCRGVVRRIVQSGRSTFHCPACQR